MIKLKELKEQIDFLRIESLNLQSHLQILEIQLNEIEGGSNDLQFVQ
jgi:hypothetical protein